MLKIVFYACVALSIALPHGAIAGSIEAALSADIRSADEKARDASRKPAETLAFFGVQADSHVLELLPGGGWYTKILGNYVREEGQLFLAVGANPERLKLDENGLQHVKIVGADIKLTPTEQGGIYQSEEESVDFGVTDMDFVLTFRNWHNLNAETRMAMNKAAFSALKPGGVYGVIDHTKRHMEPFKEDLWRRLDPVLMIKEIQAAGFVFEDFSDVHYRPNDALIYDSTHESIGRDSDRFTLKFRKPK